MAKVLRYRVDLVGWGAVSDINANAEQRRWLGPPRYSAVTLWKILQSKQHRAKLILDNQTFDDDYCRVDYWLDRTSTVHFRITTHQRRPGKC